MHDEISVSTQKTTFLRADQIDTSLLDEFILEVNSLFFTLNTSVVQSMNVDENLVNSIKDALSQDVNIGLYLEKLKDPALLRERDVQEFLKLFSLHDNDLVLHNELVYISEASKIKLQILRS